ncbi:MAG: extracellular substrate binding-like orphan protein GrrP [Prochloraceae cyanobacterium]
MYKKLSIALLSLIAPLMLPAPSWAETVMERVAKTGVLTVNTSTNLVPYTYVNDKGELVGYSIDLLELIREQLEQELGRKVELDFLTDNSFEDRIQKIISREADISCDTIFTWQRDKFVDFSISYSVSGIKLLVKKGSPLGSSESLQNKRIGLVKTFSLPRAIEAIESRAKIVPLRNLEEGFSALDRGIIDGFAYDAIILEGMRQTRRNPDAYQIVPEQSYFKHGVACMVPQNDSSFKHLVDYTTIKLMQGYVFNESPYVDIINRWFGPKGIVLLNRANIRDFFKTMIMTREQIAPN